MNASIQAAATIQSKKAEFREYTAQEKRDWAKKNAQDNAKYLSDYLGFDVNPRIPFVLLQAARDVISTKDGKSRLPAKICLRLDHYKNAIKVLAVAILNYDLANNLVATRDANNRTQRCDNGLFANLLNMPSRTVDNCIYSLKRSGLYLSFEQYEKENDELGNVSFKGVASIKRLNMALFEMLGLGKEASIQRNKAKQRAQIKQYTKTPAQVKFDEYKACDDKVRAKRNKQRADAKLRKQGVLSIAQSKNRTQDILALIEQGYSHQDAVALIKMQSALESTPDDLLDIPY